MAVDHSFECSLLFALEKLDRTEVSLEEEQRLAVAVTGRILQAYLAAKALIISLLKLWWSLNGEILWRIHLFLSSYRR